MEDEEDRKACGNCALCVHTYRGCECSISDHDVDEEQDACVDYLPE